MESPAAEHHGRVIGRHAEPMGRRPLSSACRWGRTPAALLRRSSRSWPSGRRRCRRRVSTPVTAGLGLPVVDVASAHHDIAAAPRSDLGSIRQTPTSAGPAMPATTVLESSTPTRKTLTGTDEATPAPGARRRPTWRPGFWSGVTRVSPLTTRSAWIPASRRASGCAVRAPTAQAGRGRGGWPGLGRGRLPAGRRYVVRFCDLLRRRPPRDPSCSGGATGRGRWAGGSVSRKPAGSRSPPRSDRDEQSGLAAAFHRRPLGWR